MVGILENIWNELRKSGYSEGDDITYFEFVECCENYCDVDDIDIDEFQERFNVNIG